MEEVRNDINKICGEEFSNQEPLKKVEGLSETDNFFEERLKKLERPKHQNLISKEEYELKRQRILDEI